MRKTTSTAHRQQTRSFQVLPPGDCVAVKFGDETTHYQFVIEQTADGKQVGLYRSRGESLRVNIAGNVGRCTCLLHRRYGACWHQDLARALLVRVELAQQPAVEPAPVVDQTAETAG
jgi:hypothetical protein